MNKKIIAIGIISIFVLSGFITVGGTHVKTSTERSEKQNFDINHPRNPNFSYTYKFDYIEPVDIPNKPKNNGEVDFAIDELIVWWSPFPWSEKSDYLCLYFWVKNIGDYYEGDGYMKCYVYWIYSDGHEVKELESSRESNYWPKGKFHGRYGFGTRNEKPVMMKFEIESNLPESNLENNVKTVSVDYGVTIDGTVYERDFSGEKHPVEDGRVSSDSDLSPMSLKFSYRIFYKGYYVICAPKKKGAPPFEYNLLAKTGDFGLRMQKKKTEPLDEFDYIEVNFTFKPRSRSVNSRLINSLEEYLARFPFFERLLPVFIRLLNLQ